MMYTNQELISGIGFTLGAFALFLMQVLYLGGCGHKDPDRSNKKYFYLTDRVRLFHMDYSNVWHFEVLEYSSLSRSYCWRKIIVTPYSLRQDTLDRGFYLGPQDDPYLPWVFKIPKHYCQYEIPADKAKEAQEKLQTLFDRHNQSIDPDKTFYR